MLNGDYATEMLGSGINARDTGGQCAQAGDVRAGLSLLARVASVLWTGRPPEAPGMGVTAETSILSFPLIRLQGKNDLKK